MAYSGADLGGEEDTCKSTSGIVVYALGTLVIFDVEDAERSSPILNASSDDCHSVQYNADRLAARSHLRDRNWQMHHQAYSQ
jgi:hypothetical protein